MGVSFYSQTQQMCHSQPTATASPTKAPHSMNHNAHKNLLLGLCAHPLPSATIRLKTTKAYSPDGSLDVENPLDRLTPQLDAIWHECLRLYNNAAAIDRKVTVENHR